MTAVRVSRRQVRIGLARRAEVPRLVALTVAADDAERAFSPDLVIRCTDRRRVRSYFAAALRDRAQRVLVARVGRCVIGMMGMDITRARHRHAVVRRHAFLHSLFVEPAFRGLGVAGQLVRRALCLAQRQGAQQVRLEMAAANGAARRVYESAGFRVREMMFTLDLPNGQT